MIEITGKVVVLPNENSYLKHDNELYKINKAQTRKVFNGDVIRIKKSTVNNQMLVEDVLTRTKFILGKVKKLKDDYYMIVYPNKKIRINNYEGLTGSNVLCEVTKYASLKTGAEAKFVKNVNDESLINTLDRITIENNDLPKKFNSHFINKTNNLTIREDLIKKHFITIDSENSKDLDDAIYCEKTNDGWKLMVAIADVASYVEKDSDLDKEALERSNSIYLRKVVIPMLPEELSNQICSLNENEKKNVVVVSMFVSEKGHVTNYKISNAIIESKKRLSYNIAESIIKADLIKEYETYSVLKNLESLYEVLKEKRIERGALEVDKEEGYYFYNKEKRENEFRIKKRTKSHKMIEEAMLITNTVVSEFLKKNCKNSIYRVHKKPETPILEKIKSFFNGKNDEINHKEMLERAFYSTKNIGHYGLRYSTYTHFTSPIRRYSDIVIHRLVKGIIEEESGLSRENTTLLYSKKDLSEIALQISKKESLTKDLYLDLLFETKKGS